MVLLRNRRFTVPVIREEDVESVLAQVELVNAIVRRKFPDLESKELQSLALRVFDTLYKKGHDEQRQVVQVNRLRLQAFNLLPWIVPTSIAIAAYLLRHHR